MEFSRFADEYARLLETGEKLYEEILNIRNGGADYLFCPEHLGDSIWICAFVSDYIKTHDCESVWIIGKDSQTDFLKEFPDVSGVISLTTDENEALRKYMIHKKLWNKNHIMYAHFKAIMMVDENGFHILQIDGGDAYLPMKISRKRILGIPEDYKTSPSRMLNQNGKNDEELEKLFSNAVLFVPTMQTQAGYISDEFWKKLADRYRTLGFECYTNYNGFEYERMIKDTIPLSSNVVEFATIAPYFSQVIAVRSGAADLLAEVDSNLSVVYHWKDVKHPGSIEASAREIGQLTITELVSRQNIIEYIYYEHREEELIERIVQQGTVGSI